MVQRDHISLELLGGTEKGKQVMPVYKKTDVSPREIQNSKWDFINGIALFYSQ